MKVKGYKAFNEDMTNRYGMFFEEGVLYIASPPIKIKFEGNGYHFAKRLEDTLRYVDGMDAEIKIAEVTAGGKIIEFEDDIYGYYELYVAEKIRVDKILTREEIIEEMLEKNPVFVERFIQGFKLSVEECDLFRKQFSSSIGVLNSIAYYQEGDKDVYNRRYIKQKI